MCLYFHILVGLIKKRSMKKALFLIFIFGFIFSPYKVLAQSVSSSVIGSAGAYATSSDGSMSWTIGEVMTETYSSTSKFFSQGFHQPNTINVTDIQRYSVSNITIFPNPSSGTFFINISQALGNYTFELYDLLSNLVLKETTSASVQNSIEISVHDLSNGIYLLRITNTISNISNTYKIEKSQ